MGMQILEPPVRRDAYTGNPCQSPTRRRVVVSSEVGGALLYQRWLLNSTKIPSPGRAVRAFAALVEVRRPPVPTQDAIGAPVTGGALPAVDVSGSAARLS